jgi:hypothetical protein
MFGGSYGNNQVQCAIIFDPLRNAYRDAGDLVSAGPRTIVFKLRGGHRIAHRILGA